MSPRRPAPSGVVRSKALAAGAGQWLDELPGLVEGLERDWSIRVGRPYHDSTEAYVARARLGDGTPAVLKLMIPRAAIHAAGREITALRLAGGEGCVRLLQADEARGALLLERLGRSLHELALPIAQRHEILCSAASRTWRPAPGCGLPTGADHGRWLARFITGTWNELDHPCSERAVCHALACAERRVAAHDDERAVLVHGDVHEWNALQAPGGGFKLVDPDGLLAEPEYDLGVMMREDPVELMRGDPRDRARWLAGRTGLDTEAIWEWGVAERVSTGLLATRIGLQPVGRQMLAAADQLASTSPPELPQTGTFSPRPPGRPGVTVALCPSGADCRTPARPMNTCSSRGRPRLAFARWSPTPGCARWRPAWTWTPAVRPSPWTGT